MRSLFDFFLRYSSWIVFTFYVVVSCMLLFNSNPYQHHVMLTSAGSVVGGVYDFAGNVSSYFSLSSTNEELQNQNARLEEELFALRQLVARYEMMGYSDSLPQKPYDVIVARVINNSVHRPNNYITIDRGSLDGIRPEMGVIDQNGIVGVVNVVSDHYARVISLLNPKLRLSCKVKGNDAFGSLVWDGVDCQFAMLEELPRHTIYSQGDTVVTSGYSAMFPEGIPVGVVYDTERTVDDNFYNLRIRLFTDFTRLSNVHVISSNFADEIASIEKDDVAKK